MGIKAEIHGKISSKGTNITDTLEDLLTSNVFQLLRYMSLEKGLMLVLNEATNIHGDKFTLLEDISEAEFCFWEKFYNCEPDLLIMNSSTVLDEADPELVKVWVEATREFGS